MAAERGLWSNYMRTTERHVLKFAAWLSETHPGMSADCVIQEEVTGYMKAEHTRGMSSGSVKITIEALKTFFGFLHRRNFIGRDPTDVVRRPKVDALLPNVLNESETAQLLAVDFSRRRQRKRNRTLPLRDRAIIELLYASGIRNSELVTSRVQDLVLSRKLFKNVNSLFANESEFVITGMHLARQLA